MMKRLIWSRAVMRYALLLLSGLLCAVPSADVDAQFYLRLRKVEGAGPPMEQPPGIPGQPQFTQNGANVDITWTASNPLADTYEGNYGAEDGDPDIVPFSGLTTNSHTITIAEDFWFCVRGVRTGIGTSGSSCNSYVAPPPAEVMLTWDAVTGTPVDGYRVYHGTATGVYDQALGSGLAAGTSTTYQLGGFTGELYIAVTAFNTSGESGYSNEVCWNFTTAAAC